MILSVEHVTVYRYDTPAQRAIQSLRLTPSKFEGQRVLEWDIRVETPEGEGLRGCAFRDGAGDKVDSWSVRGPVSEIAVRVRGRVETRDLAGVLRGHRESVPPQSYLAAGSAATRADAAIFRAAAEAAEGAPTGLDRAHQLAAACAAAVAYRPGVTHAHTTAAEAFALGEGVCQDHAHVLIAMARSAGMPARYVSGYLHSGEDGEAHEAAHAWAEIWVNPGLGWVGFDAANRCCPDERYIRTGSGFDSRDAAPIRGLAMGGTGHEHLDVTVAIEAQQQ